MKEHETREIRKANEEEETANIKPEGTEIMGNNENMKEVRRGNRNGETQNKRNQKSE